MDPENPHFLLLLYLNKCFIQQGYTIVLVCVVFALGLSATLKIKALKQLFSSPQSHPSLLDRNWSLQLISYELKCHDNNCNERDM
jgi:hypothetical protein